MAEQTIAQIVERARTHLSALTGLSLESTIEAKKDKAGGYIVAVELLEKKSIPDGQDLLATYRATLDAQGEVTGFERLSTRKRMDNIARTEE